jgi:hypothetical protein
MKKILFSLTVALWACGQPTVSDNNESQQLTTALTKYVNQSVKSISPENLLLLPDAEKILGEKGQLSNSSTKTTSEVTTYRCAYTANSKEQKKGKTGNVYFLFENYNQVDSARKKYSFIKTANEKHGIKVIDNLGDEAYFHTDKENFYFIMVRKGNKVYNMKVNKITSTTSLVEFNLIAKKITEAL